jgi:hypothetical protein
LIIDGEHEFDQNVLTLGNNFRIEYEQFLEVSNGDHYAMVLIKNAIIATKGNRYLKV